MYEHCQALLNPRGVWVIWSRSFLCCCCFIFRSLVDICRLCGSRGTGEEGEQEVVLLELSPLALASMHSLLFFKVEAVPFFVFRLAHVLHIVWRNVSFILRWAIFRIHQFLGGMFLEVVENVDRVK